MIVPTSLAQAHAADAADPLRGFRDRFDLPEGVIYLDGNSLGPLPRATRDRLAHVAAHEWGERLVRSWNEADWIGAPTRIGDRIARLIGAGAGEVVATDSTSVNLFKLVMAAAQLRGGAIVAEADNFPSDGHVAEEAARLLGRPFRMVSGSDMAAALKGDVAVAVVTHVNYRTAARADLPMLEAQAAAAGTRIVWDFSHSIGAVPLDVGRDGATLAIGCGYKYLNGGPGAPAWAYVARTLQPALRSPIAGWWAHAAPFAFGADFAPAPGIDRFLAGTPPMLSLLALEEGVALMQDANMATLWAKSCALFDLFAARINATCPDLACVTPSDPARRGSHISFAHPHAYGIVQALIGRGVIGDYREPAIARFGLTPLYLGFADVWRACDHIAAIVADRAWEAHEAAPRARVT